MTEARTPSTTRSCSDRPRGTNCRLRIHDYGNDAVTSTALDSKELTLKASGMKVYQMILKKLRSGGYAFKFCFVEVVGKARPNFHFIYFTVNHRFLADRICSYSNCNALLSHFTRPSNFFQRRGIQACSNYSQ